MPMTTSQFEGSRPTIGGSVMRKQVAVGTVRLMLGVVLGVEGVRRLRGGLVRAMDAMGRKWREVDKRIVGRCMVG